MHKKDNVMVLMKIRSFGLPWQDAQVWNKWKKKMQGAIGKPVFTWKMAAKQGCICS